MEEFGFGLPPRIWGKKVGETIYSLNALPIGGFVRLYGEDGSGSVKEDANKGRAYFEKPIWQRLTVLLAGVFMNLLLAVVAFAILYNIYGIPVKSDKVKIVGVSESSPAAVLGVKPEDEILAVDGQSVDSLEAFVSLTKEKAGQSMELTVKREKGNPCEKVLEGEAVEREKEQGGLEMEMVCREGNLLFYITPRENPPEGEGPLGVVVSATELKHFPWWQMPFLGAREGFKESWAWGKMILGALRSTFVSLFTQGKVPKDIAGPIGIFQVTGEATKSGAWAVVQFLGILSVNLAIINILPFPALDGGRLIFLGYEAVTRKKPNPKVEGWVNTAGMAFLLALMLLITLNDIWRLISR